MKKNTLIIFALVTFVMIFFAGQSIQAAQQIQAAASDNVQKIIIPANVLNAEQDGVTLWHDYGAFALYTIHDTTMSTLSTNQRSQITFVDDRILIDAYSFDTQKDGLTIPQEWRYTADNNAALHLIQFVGPIKSEWLKQVEVVGAEPIHYIANNAYLVWADKSAQSALAEMVMDKDFLQFSGAYEPFFKLGVTLRDRDFNNNDLLPVTIQMFRHNGRFTTENLIKGLTVESISNWDPILDYQNLTAVVHASDIPTIAQQPDVFWIGERLERELNDEVQNQILAGNLNGSQSGPSGIGYLNWLDSFGFSQDPADYPIVDVVDDGIGNGTVNSGDSTLHLFGNGASATRLAYVDNCTSDATGEGIDGHGHINASIVGGYDSRAGFPFEDPNGYLRGIGVNPYGQMAGTRIFDIAGYDLSACGGTDAGLIKNSQDNGAQISTNSWGCSSCAGTYDEGSQAYDVGTRDADLTESGNQELMFVFSAGNSGSNSGTIGTPGNGKNMLTVGASENYRPNDEDGSWADGCGIGSTGADNAMDIISFSSRGPAPGGRVKPEVIAPGTHIQGTASTNGSYTGSGVCDQYRPSGQTTFAASSGTSHSAPAVAGVSSLVYYWLQNDQPVAGAGGGYLPSPAVVKAYVMNHPTYLTGVDANDTLPSNDQGYGMPNMGTMFDNTSKHVLDQSVIFDNSGETWTWEGLVDDPSKPVRIMMVYTDKAGAIGTSPQVNDLNLSATIAGTDYYGNNFSGQWSSIGTALDSVNNYEAIFLPAGANGMVQVTVTAFNVADDGVPNVGDSTDQDFALVCYNCVQNADFTILAQPSSLDICTPADAVYDVHVGSILGYGETVDLSASGNPAGTTAVFGTASSSTPYTTTLTIGSTGSVAYNDYAITVTGMGPTTTYTSTVNLSAYTAVPSAITLVTPADTAVDVDLLPTLTWSADAQGNSYELQVATDMAFTNIVYTDSLTATSSTLDVSLSPITTYYWRVYGNNICGDGVWSAVWSFTTRDIPPILLVDDDDNSPDVRAFYTDALDALGAQYDIWDTNNTDTEPSAAELAPYTTVIWFSGDEFGGFAGPGAAGETALATWLDGGSCLFLTSQDYFYERGQTAFMTDYLGLASATSDDGGYTSVTGQGTVFNGYGPYTLDYGPVGSDFSDPLTPNGTAEVALLGNNSNNAAINKDGGVYRTTFWGFSYEAISTATDREEAMGVVLNWCGNGVDTGTLDGTVTDVDSGLGIEGATVTAGSRTVATDANGDYSMALAVGDYDVTAQASNYISATVTAVNIITDTITTVDFALANSEPIITVDPAMVEVTIPLSHTLTTPLTLINSGIQSTTFEIFEIPGGYMTTTPLAATGNHKTVGNPAFASENINSNTVADITEAPSAIASISQPFTPTNVLYDNGPFVTNPGEGAGGLDASALQSSSLGMTLFGFGHQFLNGNRIADDFVVDMPWQIDNITFFAYQTGSGLPSTITGVYLQIWDGPPNDPSSTVIFGDTTTNRMVNTTFTNNYRVTDTTLTDSGRPIMASTVDVGIILPPGIYWLDWMVDGSAASGPWAPPVTILGSTGTGNALQYTGAWAPATDIGVQDFPFIIEGLPSGDIPWLSENPITGTVDADSMIAIDVTFDTMTYTLGVYTGTLKVKSNDPVNGIIDVPVTMHIVNVEYGVEIAPPTAAITDTLGTTVTYTLQVTNTGNVTDTFDLTLSGNGWTTTLSNSSVTLPADASMNVTVQVDIPLGATSGDNDVVMVTTTSQGDGTKTDTATLTTTAKLLHLYLPIIMRN